MNGQLIESQSSVHSLEDLSRFLSSNSLISRKEILKNAQNIADNHRKLQNQVENDMESWLNVQDLVRAFEMESHNIETSLVTVETFLDESVLSNVNSTAINARLNEIQVKCVLNDDH